MNKKEPISPDKSRTQSASCQTVWKHLLEETFGQRRPADRVLAAVMRGHREFGARDRRFISETVFGFFRFWGWLRLLLPTEKAEALETTGNADLSAVEESELLLGSALLSHIPGPLPEAARVWANHLRISVPAVWDVPAVGRLLRAPDGWGDNAKLLPQWTIAHITGLLDRGKLLESMATRPSLWLRSQDGDPGKLAAELSAGGLAVHAHPALPEALAVTGGLNVYTLESFCSGRFEVQDLASQLIGLVCAPRPGQRWWDCCAGAGGKSLELAALMNRKGTVVATDIRSYKLEDLRKRSRRAGFPNIEVREWDGASPKRANFDGVLVDAPCSCSGTWRRNPDGRWLLAEPELDELAALQLDILSKAAGAVKAGGVLVYATCSMFEAENLAVVKRFLEAHPEFSLEPFRDTLTGAETPGYVQPAPLANGSDTMFAARMRRI